MGDKKKSKRELINELAEMHKQLSELKALEIQQKTFRESFRKAINCALKLGADPTENINQLTALCGELMGADCAFYNRLDKGMLISVGQWNAPPGYNPIDTPNGHICHDVIKQDSDEVFVMRDLLRSPYARTDPNVISYNLQTYVGQMVRCGDKAVGSLCVVYQRDFVPSEGDKMFMKVLASAIRIEDDRKQAVESLRMSEEHFRSLIENAYDAIVVLNEDGTMSYVSPTIKRASGYEPEDLIGKAPFELIHPDDLPEITNSCSKVRQKPGYTEHIECRIRYKDGSWHYVEAIGNNLLEDPTVTGVIVNIRDVTDRKRMEEEINQTASELQAIFQALPDLLFRLDTDGTILDYKAGNASELYVSVDEFIGQKVQNILPSDVGLRVHDAIRKANKTKSLATLEYSLPMPGGEQTYEARLLPLPEDQIISVIRNITHLKELENELRIRNEELDAFSHTISHDLRTPLAVIEGYAKTALEADEEGQREAERECLVSIIRGSRRINYLIESLLAYARMGRPEGEITCVEPRSIMQEALIEYDEHIQSMGVEVEVQRDLPPVYVDHIKLRQVLMNLMDNAIKYFGDDNPQPRIEFGASKGEKVVTFYFRDNGIGIHPKEQEEIFEPFIRLGTTEYHGLGIGLSTVRRAVEGWGGRTWVESAPGEGATFFFTASGADRDDS